MNYTKLLRNLRQSDNEKATRLISKVKEKLGIKTRQLVGYKKEKIKLEMLDKKTNKRVVQYAVNEIPIYV